MSATGTRLGRKRIPVGRGDSFLILDQEEALYRCAFYRRLRPNEAPDPVPAGLFEQARTRGWFGKRERAEGWRRHAGSAPRLEDALRIALDGSPYSFRELVDYVRATAWGEGLR